MSSVPLMSALLELIRPLHLQAVKSLIRFYTKIYRLLIFFHLKMQFQAVTYFIRWQLSETIKVECSEK